MVLVTFLRLSLSATTRFISGHGEHREVVDDLVNTKQEPTIRRLAPTARPPGRPAFADFVRVTDHFLEIIGADAVLVKVLDEFIGPLEVMSPEDYEEPSA
jgi:hypothetical protein